MPFTTRKIWCTGRLRSLSGFGATSTGQLSEPTSSGSCFASHSAAATAHARVISRSARCPCRRACPSRYGYMIASPG